MFVLTWLKNCLRSLVPTKLVEDEFSEFFKKERVLAPAQEVVRDVAAFAAQYSRPDRRVSVRLHSCYGAHGPCVLQAEIYVNYLIRQTFGVSNKGRIYSGESHFNKNHANYQLFKLGLGMSLASSRSA